MKSSPLLPGKAWGIKCAGELLSADTFFVGSLKGVGKVCLHAVVAPGQAAALLAAMLHCFRLRSLGHAHRRRPRSAIDLDRLRPHGKDAVDMGIGPSGHVAGQIRERACLNPRRPRLASASEDPRQPEAERERRSERELLIAANHARQQREQEPGKTRQ